MAKRFSSIEEKREYNRETMRRWRERNPDKVEGAKEAANKRSREWAKAHPERHAANMARWRKKAKECDPEGFREKRRISAQVYRNELRIRCIEAYGGMCTCCGDKHFEFLTFDHMDGHGREHRKANGLMAPYAFLLWVWNEGNLQPRIRLLCFNCNCSIGFLGFCPHSRERAEIV